MQNIKLILSDMDGTLLNSKKELPHDFDDILEKLKEHDIRFAVASGRGYVSLKESFLNHLNDIYFIADNGTQIYYQDKCIYKDILKQNDILLIDSIFKDTPYRVIYAACSKSYAKDYDYPYLEHAKIYYKTLTSFHDFSEINEEICKIAVYSINDANENVMPLLVDLPKNLACVYSSPNWVDISNSSITKGSALKHLQQMLNISYYETMAFGDYNNDLELLENSYYSYAMENATVEVKEVANFTTTSNDDEGVTRIIKKVVNIDD